MSAGERAFDGRLHVSRGGLVLAVYAALLLAVAMALPWWRMENRAPQYGKRVLVVDVSPWGVKGDVFEIDNLGHYVGIPKMETLARRERTLAPYALPLTVLCALALPFLGRGKPRLVLALVVAAVPLGFALDLWYWQRYAVNNLDPHAALNMIADRIRSQVWGKYSVAQFQVHAMFEAGFWLAVVAGANALGFLYAERGGGERRPTTPARADAARSGLAGAGAAVLLGLALAGEARAATLEAGPRSPYATIGAAIAAAAPGDEIVVRTGTYLERVTIAKPLVLRGEAGTIVDGGGRGTVVMVTAGPSVVRGLGVRGSGDSLLREDAGIKVDGASDCTVEGNRIEDSLFGILARHSPRVRVVENRVVGKALPLPRRGDGIRLQDAPDSLVEGNTVVDSRDLAIWQSHRCVVRRNEVRGGRYGLHTMYLDDGVFVDNVFAANHTGGAIMYSRGLELRRNRFAGSRGPSAYGLLVKVADDVVAEGNWFVDNTIGIFLEDVPSSRRSTCTLRNNVIGGNETGLALQPSVSRALFHGNLFLVNRVQLEVLGRARGGGNRWSHEGRGNYWSDYVGFDADGDGIGDTPYRVEQFFEGLAERWPGAGLLRMGPAAEALEMAVRAFPIARPDTLATDDHPLMVPPPALGPPPRVAASPLLAGAGLVSFAASCLALGLAVRMGSGGRA